MPLPGALRGRALRRLRSSVYWSQFWRLLAVPAGSVAQTDWTPPRTVFISETGQTIDGVFLDQWRAGGGANAYGYPITAELTENDHIVQYYEYARFEYVPEDPDGIVVHLGKIGEELRPVTVFRTMPDLSGRLRQRLGQSRIWRMKPAHGFR